MQLHDLPGKKKQKKRVGRGGKRGTYSGRGIKGQKARAGRRIRPQLRDVLKKIPKRRGYRFRVFRKKPSVVNTGILERHFEVGAIISPKTLVEKGLVSAVRKQLPRVKLLGSGTLTKKLLVEHCQVSQSAKEKIEKAGGSIR